MRQEPIPILLASVCNSHGCVGSDRKSTRLNSSHLVISYAVFCLKKKKNTYLLEKFTIRFHKVSVVLHTANDLLTFWLTDSLFSCCVCYTQQKIIPPCVYHSVSPS